MKKNTIGHDVPSKTLGVKPALFSFITLRKESDGGFLYNPYHYNEIALNPLEYTVLELCDSTHSIDEINEAIERSFSYPFEHVKERVNSVLNKMTKNNSLNWVDTTFIKNQGKVSRGDKKSTYRNKLPPSSYRLSVPISVLWEITNKCNLKCKHCLSEAGDYGREELKYDAVISILNKLKAAKVFKITFGGGEPLVRSDFYNILDEVTKRNMGIKLTTNGYLVDSKLIDRLEETNVTSVQVSLDGLENTHNELRGNDMSFKKALNAIHLFSEAGYFTLVTTAISKKNLNEIEEVLDIVIRNGASAYKPSPFVPVGRGLSNYGLLSIDRTDIASLANRMVSKQLTLSNDFQIQLDGLFPWLLSKPHLKVYDKKDSNEKIGCSAGHSQFVITTSGDVIPCAFLRDMVAGNLLFSSLQEIWDDNPVFDRFRRMCRGNLKGKCKACEFIPDYCMGGCRASAYSFTGDLFETDPHCWKLY